MGLRLHNTLTRTKENFVPIDPANVRMYVCGPTVYDFAHIGNARPLIVFDVLFRLLRHLYGPEHVTYVRNITDVDDKIIVRAAEEFPLLPLNEAIRKVTQRTTRQFHEDVAALGCLPPTVEPRATDHIAEMRAMIEELIAKGFAYPAADHVLFRVAAMKDYGRLSNRSLDDMLAGARVEVAPYKQDPMDFVLWKPSKPGEPAWPSPAGIAAPGRPGWHLECSAMSDRWLWDEVKADLSPEGLAHPHEFDIHGGGIDLVFPHHENEIAQSRCAHGTPVMANYWLHNGFLQIEGEKMSKSLGNFVTIRDLRSGWHGEQWAGAYIRFALLQTHYRQPIDWTLAGLKEAANTIDEWSRFIGNAPAGEPPASIVEAMSDDLNSPLAVAELHAIRKRGDSAGLRAGLSLLGVGLVHHVSIEARIQTRVEARGEKMSAREVIAKAESLIAARAAARKGKDYAEADRIRAELDAMGIALKDSKDPETGELVTTWEVKR